MIGLNLAVVHEQRPDQNGVLVAWRDGTSQQESGTGWGFCRVLEGRAHPTLGSSSDLPAVGELGLVATVDAEVSVWIGSVHWQANNPIAPAVEGVPRRSFWHHDSGACLQIDQEGALQVDLPSGIQIRNNGTDTPWPLPSGSSKATPGGAVVHPLTIAHPSGLSIQISPFGDLSITDARTISATSAGVVDLTAYGAVTIQTLPMAQDPLASLDEDLINLEPPVVPNVDITVNGAGAVNLNATGAVNVAGASVALMDGSVQFAMKPFVDWVTSWLTSHVHAGVTTGGGTSAVPTVTGTTASTPPAAALSGPTLTGKSAS